jgi:HEAT repeat protein
MNGEAPVSTLPVDLQPLQQELRAARYKDREAAVEALAALGHAGALRLLIDHLATEKNANLRKLVITKLHAVGRPEAIAPLEALLVSDDETHLRLAAARALGDLGRQDPATAVDSLISVLKSKGADRALLYTCAEALEKLGSPAAVNALAEQLLTADAWQIRAAVATLLGKGPHQAAANALVTAARDDKEDKVRLAAVAALPAVLAAAARPHLEAALFKDPAASVRARAAKTLGALDDAAVVAPLCRALLELKDPEVQANVLEALEQRHGWQAKTQIVIDLLRQGELQRAQLDEATVVRAIRPTPAELSDDSHLLTDYLINQTRGQPDALVGCLAALIVESAGGSLTTAGERVNAYQARAGLSDADLQHLRVEIGGKTALDPMLQLLQEDLRKYFREPIAELNTLTQRNWAQTIRFAQYAFVVRIVMSVLVFVVGLGLLVLSSWRIMFGALDTTQLFGAGVSFVSGLGAMLLIVYSGPLREIRNSMNELGIASAAFIAYIHRVLQISHTYSYYYLSQKITFDEMRVSSELIEACMNGTIAKLAPGQAPGADELIEKALERLAPKKAPGA